MQRRESGAHALPCSGASSVLLRHTPLMAGLGAAAASKLPDNWRCMPPTRRPLPRCEGGTPSSSMSRSKSSSCCRACVAGRGRVGRSEEQGGAQSAAPVMAVPSVTAPDAIAAWQARHTHRLALFPGSVPRLVVVLSRRVDAEKARQHHSAAHHGQHGAAGVREPGGGAQQRVQQHRQRHLQRQARRGNRGACRKRQGMARWGRSRQVRAMRAAHSHRSPAVATHTFTCQPSAVLTDQQDGAGPKVV